MEGAYGLSLDSRVIPYPSYINRVYSLRDEEGQEWVAKFYRPDRWNLEALEEEHLFLEDCGEAELPVILPELDLEGYTLSQGLGEDGQEYRFALYPKKSGRVFDAEGEGDWLRLGRLTGRLHRVARSRGFRFRPVQTPDLTRTHLQSLGPLVHPDLARDFEDIVQETGEILGSVLPGSPLQRVHGDLHRGNILDRGPEGLLLMDFDDCLLGPPVQDLWLLLPGKQEDCRREIALLTEGYSEQGDPFDLQWDLVEPLRLMRMIHFLAWCGLQRGDLGFERHFPGWGTRSFWIKEVEDLRDQIRTIRG